MIAGLLVADRAIGKHDELRKRLMRSALNIRMQDRFGFAFGLKRVLNDAACNKVLDVLRACNAVDDVSWPAASSRVARRDLHKAPAIFLLGQSSDKTASLLRSPQNAVPRGAI